MLYAECLYAKCHYAECYCAECHYAECHYAECHYAECRGASVSLCFHYMSAIFSCCQGAADWTRTLEFKISNRVLYHYATAAGKLTDLLIFG